MPQAKNIVVKNGSGVDQTFTLTSPAAGDGGVAAWRLKVGDSSNAFPQLQVSTQQKPTSRTLRMKFFVPITYTDPITGQTQAAGRAEMNLTWALPNAFPEAKKADTVAFIKNILANQDIQDALLDAVPLT